MSEFTPPSKFFVDRSTGQWRILNAMESGVELGYSYEDLATRTLYTPLLRAFVAIQVRGMLQQAFGQSRRSLRCAIRRRAAHCSVRLNPRRLAGARVGVCAWSERWGVGYLVLPDGDGVLRLIGNSQL